MDLSPEIAALMQKARDAREGTGCNVRFTDEDGTPDLWSFATKARADAFRRSLDARGIKHD